MLFPQSVPVPTVSSNIPDWMLSLSPNHLESFVSIDELDCTCKEQCSEGIFLDSKFHLNNQASYWIHLIVFATKFWKKNRDFVCAIINTTTLSCEIFFPLFERQIIFFLIPEFLFNPEPSGVTKREFLLTISIQYRAEKWWE